MNILKRWVRDRDWEGAGGGREAGGNRHRVNKSQLSIEKENHVGAGGNIGREEGGCRARAGQGGERTLRLEKLNKH